MIVVYTEGSNHSCRQTIRWFRNEKIPIKERIINHQHPITKNELRWLLSQTDNGVKDILKYRILKTKQFKLDFNKSKLYDVIDLIIANPSLLKNPIITDGRKLVAGYNGERIRCFVPKNRRQEWRERNVNYPPFG
ncbi:ArsC/Spx/MgsR family protein [Enterococcus gilvus]|uniref:ArsC/Spx/MgsR family protein n=1 Tax=Enterococcus gilvus TaxID=160453 RepID=UPI003ED88BD9